MRKRHVTWHRTLFGLACLLALALPPAASAQDWQARNGLDENGLREANERFKAEDLIPSTWSGYRDGENLRYAGLWERFEGDWLLRRGLTQAALDEAIASLDREGYGLVRLGAHAENGKVVYSGLWVGNSIQGLVAKVGMTAAGYQAEFDRQLAAGRHPLQVRPYDDGGQVRYLGVFGKMAVPAWQARHNLSQEAYQLTFDKMKAAGYLPVQVSGAHVGGRIVYAAIWHANTQRVAWKARHGMDTAAYNADFLKSVEDGYHLLHQDTFDVDGRPTFATVWIK